MSETETDTRPYTYTFEVTREAVTTISEMREHCIKLGAYWGQRSNECQEALLSFVGQIGMLIGNPLHEKTTITRDGDKSLYVAPTENAGIVFGVIWHGKKRHCTDPECHAWIDNDGTTWTWSTEKAPILDHEHTPSYPLDAPQPGTWSFHS